MTIPDQNGSSPRKSLTKKQLQTEIGIELLSLCQAITQDGRLSEQELDDLKQWLSQNKASDLPAIGYLSDVIERIIADGKITDEEYRDLHIAIETVLPTEIRSSARAQRRTIELAERDAKLADREASREATRAERERNRPIEYADFMVAGVRYEGRAQIISKFVSEGDTVFLNRDHDNQFSTNAIQVCINTGKQIGFVPEVDACVLAPLLDQGCRSEASIKKILGYGRVPIPVVIARLYRADSGVPLLSARAGQSRVAAKGSGSSTFRTILLSIIVLALAVIIGVNFI